MVMDYLARDFWGLWTLFFKPHRNESPWRTSNNAECARTPAGTMWSRKGTYVIGTNVSVIPFEGKTMLPLSSYFDAAKGHIANGYIGFKLLYWVKGEAFTCYVSKIQTLKFEPHTVVTIIYHTAVRILHCRTVLLGFFCSLCLSQCQGVRPSQVIQAMPSTVTHLF